jgi:hypothetical protein
MTEARRFIIPFEKQQDRATEKRCAAAAMCMVYRALGLSVTQEDVWPRVSCRECQGSRLGRTYLLARDAQERGLEAVVVAVAEPWTALRHLARMPVLVVLNLRVHSRSSAGHYAVVRQVQEDGLFLHDPALGPDQWLTREEFLHLWQAGGQVMGPILVAVSRPAPDTAGCRFCFRQPPVRFLCPGCRQPIRLSPWAALGCWEARCPGRLWKTLYCPRCDCGTS